MKYKLMIKTHLHTGLKYLCVTTRKEYHKYSGSGKEWKKHLNEHGRAWSTQLVFESDNKDEFSKKCFEQSILNDIVNSTDWANSIIEHGGGEYPVDEDGNRILAPSISKFSSEEEMLEFCRTSKWFECAVCGARMTEGAYTGTGHKKCKQDPAFKMIPVEYQEYIH